MARFRYAPWLQHWLWESSFFDFEWDAGNHAKNARKHGVTVEEIEQVFFLKTAAALGVQVGPAHAEERLGLVGATKSGRILQIAFARRNGKVRVISARPAHRKERALYETTLCEK